LVVLQNIPKHNTSALHTASSPRVGNNPDVEKIFTQMTEESESKLLGTSRGLEAYTVDNEGLGRFPILSKSRQGTDVLLRRPRPQTQRALSNPQIELRSSQRNTVDTPIIEQLKGDINPKHDGTVAPEFPQTQTNDARRAYHSDFGVENTAPGLLLYGCARSNSDPDLRTTFAAPERQQTIAPLKTCMKKKARSTTASPPAESCDIDDDDSDLRTLRRVKTVDFVKTSEPLLAVKAQVEKGKKSVQVAKEVSCELSAETLRPKAGAYRTTSCPHTISSMKSGLADPATTRTDVHVIAIAPSRNINHAGNEGAADPATPTMQIVESNNGCYEVIWDGLPSEHSIRADRRSSSASHSLIETGSTFAHGLQRVNSKLTDWSGTWNTPSEDFKPTIAVFPDDDGRRSHFEPAVENEEDSVAIAPPNSQRTSTAPSRLPSRPVSAPMTRIAPQEDLRPEKTFQEDPPMGWTVPTLTVPCPDVQTMHGTRRVLGFRKLSNLEEDELKFRGHRDSVTLAHSRLVHSGGVSPELFAHRDSLSIARKRMHARNHAISSMRDMPIPKTMLPQATFDEDDSDSDLLTVKERAVQALKNKTSASMFDAQQPGNRRHISITE
jgi:hypothetical protein